MITAGINLVIISVLILIIGLINPKWLLVWVEKPGRMPIILLASVVFMVGMTLFGEGSKRKKEAEASGQPVAESSEKPPVESSEKKPAKIISTQDLVK